jgi:hypothetical protein
MKKQNLLLTALLGTTIVANAFAVPPKVDMCTGRQYDAGNGYCEHCPSNYNNSGEKFSIEECCIDELTYDSESGLCVAVASNEPEETPMSCDNETLGTYTGPTTLAAQWNANTINLDFYDGENKLSSGTCTYDGGIELPNDPTKTGYEFSGWKVRRAAAPKQRCWEITNSTVCGNTTGCIYYNGSCQGLVDDCSTLRKADVDCYHYAQYYDQSLYDCVDYGGTMCSVGNQGGGK